MLRVYDYKKKEVTHTTISDYHKTTPTWILASAPTKLELQHLSRAIEISPADLKLCLDPDERPRIEQKENYTLIILKTPLTKKDHSTTTTISFFITKTLILSLLPEKVPFIEAFFKQQEEEHTIPKSLEVTLYDLLDTIVKEFSTQIDVLEEQIDKIESKIFKKKPESTLHETLNTKKTILYFRKGVHDNQNIIEDIEQGRVGLIKTKKRYHNIFIEYLQLSDTIAVLGERVTSITDLSINESSYRINNVMKVFTVLAAVLLLPTIISGMYGMNLHILPLANHPYSFWILGGIMVASVLASLAFFKIVKWL